MLWYHKINTVLFSTYVVGVKYLLMILYYGGCFYYTRILFLILY